MSHVSFNPYHNPVALYNIYYNDYFRDEETEIPGKYVPTVLRAIRGGTGSRNQMDLILKPTLSPLPHTAVDSSLPGNTGQQRTDSRRAFTIASWLLLGLNHCADTVGFHCGKGTSRNFCAVSNVLSNPAADDKFLPCLWGCLQWPSWFSAMQSNSALHYKFYVGTISHPLVLEQQNPKVYWTGVWSLAVSRDFVQRRQCATAC